MSLLQTDAVVLHVADYLESSRILRLATRDAGVQSVVARGARSSKKRFGSAVDLFAEGQAQIQMKPGRDLHALNAFDVTIARPALALDLGRFTAASAISETVLRFVHEESVPAVYETLVAGLDRLSAAAPDETASVTLSLLWQLVAEVGYRPSIDRCVECHELIAPDEQARFHPVAGGTVCARCARRVQGGRLLPTSARETLRRWLEGETTDIDGLAVRAHQRLLREFLMHHLSDLRPLKAFTVWEQGHW